MPGERVVSGGFGDIHNMSISQMAAVGEYLYAGTENGVSGGEIWRSLLHGDAGSWEQVNLDGFGDINNTAVTVSGGGWPLSVRRHAQPNHWRRAVAGGAERTG